MSTLLLAADECSRRTGRWRNTLGRRPHPNGVTARYLVLVAVLSFFSFTGSVTSIKQTTLTNLTLLADYKYKDTVT